MQLEELRSKLAPGAIAIMTGAQLIDTMSITGLMFNVQSIAFSYGISEEDASWVISAYSLALGSFQLLGGKLGDYLGHRFMFMFGMIWYGVCSIILATVKNVFVIYVFRALQGIGAALSVPSSYGLIIHNYSGQMQAIAISSVGSAASIGCSVGVLIGAKFAEMSIQYRGFMYLVMGIAWLLAFSIFFSIQETPSDRENLKRIDYIGTFILISGFVLIVFAFTSAPGRWSSARFIAPLIVGLFLLVIFYFFETYCANQYFNFHPLVPNYVWKFKNLIPIMVYLGALVMALNCCIYVVALESIDLRHQSPIRTAVQMLSLSVTFMIGAIIGGASFGRLNIKFMLIAAASLVIVGLGLYTRVRSDNGFWQTLFPAHILLSFGGGVGCAIGYNVAPNSTPLDHQGIVNALVNTAAQLSVAVGMGIATSELADGFELKGYQEVYYTFMAFMALALIVAIFFIQNPKGLQVGMQQSNMKGDEEAGEAEEAEEAEETSADEKITDSPGIEKVI